MFKFHKNNSEENATEKRIPKRRIPVSMDNVELKNIKGYEPDGEDLPFIGVVNNLNFATITGYEKKPIKAAVAVAEVSPEHPKFKTVGDIIILMDRKVYRMSLNPLMRKKILALIELQISTFFQSGNEMVELYSDGSIGRVEPTDINVAAHAQTASAYGYSAMKKAVNLQNKTLLRSEKWACKKLYKDVKKGEKQEKHFKKTDDPVDVIDREDEQIPNIPHADAEVVPNKKKNKTEPVTVEV